MMSMAVHSQNRLVAINHFGEPSAPEVGIDLFRLALYRFHDRRVVSDYDALFGAQHRQGAFELERLVNRGLDDCLDLGFTEGGKHASSETSDEAFCPGESHTIAFISAAIEYLHTLVSHHFCEFYLLAAFEVVIAKHGDDGNTNAHERG